MKNIIEIYGKPFGMDHNLLGYLENDELNEVNIGSVESVTAIVPELGDGDFTKVVTVNVSDIIKRIETSKFRKATDIKFYDEEDKRIYYGFIGEDVDIYHFGANGSSSFELGYEVEVKEDETSDSLCTYHVKESAIRLLNEPYFNIGDSVMIIDDPKTSSYKTTGTDACQVVEIVNENNKFMYRLSNCPVLVAEHLLSYPVETKKRQKNLFKLFDEVVIKHTVNNKNLQEHIGKKTNVTNIIIKNSYDSDNIEFFYILNICPSETISEHDLMEYNENRKFKFNVGDKVRISNEVHSSYSAKKAVVTEVYGDFSYKLDIDGSFEFWSEEWLFPYVEKPLPYVYIRSNERNKNYIIKKLESFGGKNTTELEPMNNCIYYIHPFNMNISVIYHANMQDEEKNSEYKFLVNCYKEIDIPDEYIILKNGFPLSILFNSYESAEMILKKRKEKDPDSEFIIRKLEIQ